MEIDKDKLVNSQVEILKYLLIKKIKNILDLLIALGKKIEELDGSNTEEKLNILVQEQHLFEILTKYTVMLEEIDDVANGATPIDHNEAKRRNRE